MKNKEPLKKIVQGLIRRRLQHQARINKLLDPKYLQEQTNSSLRKPHGQLSEVLRNLDDQETPQQQSIGNLGNHVNLLATVSLKTQYFLTQKPHILQPGQLHNSLASKFIQAEFQLTFGSAVPLVDFGIQKLVEYLQEQELVQGLFSLRQNGNCKEYFGTCFINGKHQEIHLSKQGLLHSQEHLIVDLKQRVKAIGWILLTRLLLSDPSQSISFPQALHKLFSFPHKTFKVRESLQFIRFNDFFTSSSTQQKQSGLSFTFLGQNQEGKTQILNLSQVRNLRSNSRLIRQFPIIHALAESDLPVRSLPLSCLKNHFVVITISSKNSDYYFFTLGGEKGKQKFRVCLLDYDGNIVKHEIIRSGEFIFCRLADQQYQLYVSPQPPQQMQQNAQQSFELVKQTQINFHFWVQGKSVISRNGNLQLQIRLKEQYNRYTFKIAMNYLKSIKQQPQKPSLQEKVHIQRYHIQVMDLVIDKINFQLDSELQIKYQHSRLCDEHFQEQAIIVHPNDYVTHYCKNEVEAVISIEKGQDNIPVTITSHFL